MIVRPAIILIALCVLSACSSEREKPRGQKIAFDHCTPEVSFAKGYDRDKAAAAFWTVTAESAVATTEDADLARTGLRCVVTLPAKTDEVKVFFGNARTTLNERGGSGFGLGVLVYAGGERGHVRYSDTDGGEALDLDSKGADVAVGRDPTDTTSVTVYPPHAQTIHFDHPVSQATVILWVEEPWAKAHSRTEFAPVWVASDAPAGGKS